MDTINDIFRHLSSYKQIFLGFTYLSSLAPYRRVIQYQITRMKYKIIHKNNSLNPRNRLIDQALSNAQQANPLETKYATSYIAQMTSLMDLWMMKMMENDDGTFPSW